MHLDASATGPYVKGVISVDDTNLDAVQSEHESRDEARRASTNLVYC